MPSHVWMKRPHLRTSMSMPSIEKLTPDNAERQNSEGAEKIIPPSYKAFDSLNVECNLKCGNSESRLTSAHLYTKRISHAVLDIPTKIIHSENLGSYRRETKHFSETTTLHGPKRIWQGKRRSFFFWLFMVCTSISLLSLQVYSLCSLYWNKPVLSQVSFQMKDNGMDFPVVTICNYNPIKSSRFNRFNKSGDFSELLYDYVLESNVEPPALFSSADRDELSKGEEALKNYQTLHPKFTINNFFMKVGFECKDVFKLCSFDSRKFDCCEIVESVFTNMGKCFIMNTRKQKWSRRQMTAGVHAGLQLIVDAHVGEERTGLEESGTLAPSFETGFRYYIHDPNTLAYMNSEGISVSPGMRVYSALATTGYILLDEDNWGNCTNEWPAIFPTETKFPYTAATCEYRYRAKVFNDTCNCSPTNYDVDDVYSVCTPYQTVECMKSMRKNQSDHQEHIAIPKCKDCKIECSSMVYESFNSYGKLFSKSALRWLRSKNHTWSDDYVRRNFATINIFFRDMSHTEYTQVQATSLTELLSNIGGNMGMFLGMSLITMTEITLFLSKMFWIVVSKQRRKYMADKKKREEEKRKEVEETVQEFKRIRSSRSMNRIDLNASDARLENNTADFSVIIPTNNNLANQQIKGSDNLGFACDKPEERPQWS